MTALNVLYDHQIFHAQRYGGVSRYFQELITRVARLPETEVSFFQGFNIHSGDFERSKADFARFFGRKRPGFPKAAKVFSAVNTFLLRAFAAGERPDVYHLTYYGDPHARLRCARVLTVYDMIHELFPEEFRGDPTAARKRAAVAKADRIIAISESTRQDLIRILNVEPRKVEVVHLANSLCQGARPNSPIPFPYLLYVGNRGGYKNFNAALLAFARSRRLSQDFRLLCFGGGPFSTEEQRTFAELGVTDRVLQRAGTDEDLATYYSHAVLMICPSLYEGFGLPLLEAMNYGCPVLSGRTSSMPEVAGDAASYFDARDIESVKAAIEAGAYDSTLAHALATRGRERVKQFSWDRCASDTREVYGRA